MTGLDFGVVLEWYQVLLTGMMYTIVLCVSSTILCLVGGVPLAVVSISRNRFISVAMRMFLGVFRGTPLLLQLFVIYFGLPHLGIFMSPVYAGILGLSLHYAVYNADVIRAGIVAVDIGQHEASRSLGLSRTQTLWKVVIPQALRNVTMPIGNNVISLMKESALVSIITVPELTLSAQRAISETFRPFEFYIMAGLIYYILNYVLEYGLKRLEVRTALSR